jgi:hypothetical protein
MRPLLKSTVPAIGCIVLLASGTTYSQTTVRMEAEDMQLNTYRIEMLDFASNGALINLKGEGFVGTATAPFPGVGGEYDIRVVYHDENDGLAQLTVSIDDREVDSWTLDRRVKGGEQPIVANRFTREIATGYTVATGDEITISGLQGNWDHANVDYIEFTVPDTNPMITRIEVLDGSIILGDPPRNNFWETEVDIDGDVLGAAKSAHVGLYTIHNALGRLVINGEVMQLPYVELSNQYSRWRAELGQTLVSVPLGYFHAGTNTIRFESGIGNWTTENVYDDYEFGEVEIIFSLR